MFCGGLWHVNYSNYVINYHLVPRTSWNFFLIVLILDYVKLQAVWTVYCCMRFLFVLCPCLNNASTVDPHATVPCLISPSPVPLSWDSTAFLTTWALTSLTVPFAINPCLLSPDGPWQTLHWEKITAFVFVVLITLSPFHVHELWFQATQKLGK